MFVHASSKNPGIDNERFSMMLDTARQLSEGLDAHLLDDYEHQPLTMGDECYCVQLPCVDYLNSSESKY